MKRYILLFALIPFIAGCSSVDKMIDIGHYDHAILKSSKKLYGKARPKRKHILALEKAYAVALESDFFQISRLKNSDRSTNWGEILSLYRKMDRRQESLRFLLPLVAKDGHQATFTMHDFSDAITHAEVTYVAALYDEASLLIESARFGDRPAAREAFHLLDRIRDFRTSYFNTNALLAESKALGKTHVRLDVENHSLYRMNTQILESLLVIGYSDPWVEFHVPPTETDHFDFIVTIEINDIIVTPERIHETISREQREIKDGFAYLLDEKGNVRKDTLGNDLKEPKYKMVRAKVITTELFKSARIEASIRYSDISIHSNNIIPLNTELVFSHLGARFVGDKRALKATTKNLLKNHLPDFPDDHHMVSDALQQLRPLIWSKIESSDLYASL